jgi:predicted TPR repeat methyltransferase
MNRQERRARMSDVANMSDNTAHFAADMQAATTLFKEGQYKAAADTFRRIVKVYAKHPDLRVAWTNLGAACQELGDFDEAVQCFKKARSLKPDHAPSHNNLGMALLSQGKLDEAEAALREALALDPTFGVAWASLASLMEQRGDLEGAEAATREALALNDNDAVLHFNLANLVRSQGKIAEAVELYRRAIELRPGFPEALVNLGSTLGEDGDAEGSAEALLAALRLIPQHEGVHTILGESLQAMAAKGSHERAQALAREWRAGHPGSPTAQHMSAAALGSRDLVRASDSYVRVRFDGFAHMFDEMQERSGHTGAELLREALAGTLGPAPVEQGDLDVLDAGCGTGRCGAFLKPYARQLTGVDLSPNMLQMARARGIYHRLIAGELAAFLGASKGGFDLIAGSDVLAYFGDLGWVLDAASGALRPGGHLALSLETGGPGGEGGDWSLLRSGRFAHSDAYLRQALEKAGLEVLSLVPAERLRMEQGQAMPGLVAVAKKP